MREVGKKDLKQLATMFSNAFKDDPVWSRVLDGIDPARVQAFFEGPLRYGLRYGSVYTTSDKLEGAAVWLPGKYAEITGLRGIISGSAIPSMKIGMKFLRWMFPIFKPLEEFKREYMSGRDYLYLMILGVDPQFWRQGFAKILLKGLIDEAEKKSLPIYLETSTKENIEIYRHFGFDVVGEIIHPVIELPQWVMVRDV